MKTRNLIVLNKTVIPAILVEYLFADSDGADKYNAEVIARSIVSGLVGVDATSDGEGCIFDDNGYALQDVWYYDENEKD